MTIVVLLILVLVWALVLGPSLLRRGVKRRSVDSIGAFHRQLRVLQRTGPSIVAPVHRLDTTLPSTHVGAKPRSGGRPGLIVVRPDTTLPLSAPAAASASRRPDPYFRPDACKRRRDVLVALVFAIVCTGLPGAIPTLRPILFVTAFAALALVGYLALLVRLRNSALEREVKLRYLPRPADRESSIVVRRVVAR